MRDHDPITLTQFLGIYDRGDEDSVPPGFFKDARNIRFLTKGVESREGTTLDITLGSIRRMAVYKRVGEAQRLLLLDDSGQLWDSLNLVTPILSIAAMTDFSVEVMFNRAYISPHNGVTGLPGEKVYVYDGTGVARPAAGSAPTGAALSAADSAVSGNCEEGTHVLAVCYETASGFLTKPGGFVEFSPVGGKSIDLSNIPVGPASTVARVIVSTKAILNFNGDFENQEYFLVPGGRLAGNVDTTLTVSYFDENLQASVDYLLDQLEEIPAGVGLTNYRGHLVVFGEDANSSIARVSKAGDPESHNAVEGFLTVNPGDNSGGIANAAEYRKQLLLFKDERSYVSSDNGEEAAFWDVDSIDPSIGTSCHGVAAIRDFGDSTRDRIFIASRPGLQMFTGTFSDNVVSFNVDAIWERITDSAFHTIEVVIDPKSEIIYIAVPLDGATSPNYVLIGDYTEGFENFKWSLDAYPEAPTTIAVDVDNATKASVFKYGSIAGNVYKVDSNSHLDHGLAINSYYQMGHLPVEDDEKIYHFTGVRLRARGSGALVITIYGEDEAHSLNAQGLPLATTPGRALFRGFSFTNEKASVKIEVAGAGDFFRVMKHVLYLTPVWDTRPE